MTSPNPVQPAARAERPQAPPSAAAGAAGTADRLAWLDVLRGLAALCVVFNHFGYFVPTRLNGAVYQWINPGDYGVFVFFLISGYIVPSSLERKAYFTTNLWSPRISYSVYLLHPPLIQVYRRLSWTAHHPFWLQVLIDALFVAVLLAVCSMTYLFVERPMQDAGRRLARRLDARYGPDRHPVQMRAREPALAHSSGAG